MKNNIIRICLAAALAALLASCSEKIDNSEYSDMLGKDYNQKLLWNPDSLAFRRADWQTVSLSGGAELLKAQIGMLGGTQSVSYISYPSSMFYTEIAASASMTTSQMAASKQAVFAVSGTSGTESFVMIDKEVVSQGSAQSGAGALAIHKFEDESPITIIPDASSSSVNNGTYTSGLIAGPVLVRDGKEQTFDDTQENTSRMARTIIGSDGDEYFMAVIDGGVTGQADGATMAEAAFIARIIGMKDAVCLSSGDASTLWSEDGGVVSHPSGNGIYDNTGEAQVGNIVYVTLSPPFVAGTGTSEDPYQMKKKKHLMNMSQVLKDDEPVYFKLTEDIDMSDIDWTPLNYQDPYPYQIYLDGDGHTLLNFHCDYQTYPSFFGVLYGECRNIRFSNAEIDATASNSAGIIGGYIGTTGKPGLLENSYIAGTVTFNSADVSHGGVAGNMNNGTVRNCFVDVEAVCSNTGPNVFNRGVGGIVGQIQNSSTIENCFVAGKALGQKTYNTGGVAGHTDPGHTNRTIRNNISWLSEINGRVAAGNIVGRWRSTEGSTIENNYSNPATVLTTYTNEDAVSEGIYGGGAGSDYADCGIKATDTPSRIASENLGWSSELWDFSGSIPLLKMFLVDIEIGTENGNTHEGFDDPTDGDSFFEDNY